MAYAMYLRKSRADDELGYENTLERHEEMLGELAQRHNIHVDEQNIYREIVSGESIEARPQMQRLLKAVEAGMYTAVLCIELERLSRGNGSDQSRILRSFQFSDTKIITLNKTYDLASDDEFDEEFFEFGLFMSRREYKTIKRRLYRGRMQAQKEGYFIGSRTPLGYGKKRIGKGYVLVPDDYAPVIQEVFRRYGNGETPADICHSLNARGYRSYNDSLWTAERVRKTVGNRVYLGYINTKCKNPIKTMENGVVKERVLNITPTPVEGKHEAIIDEETWNKCQAVLESKKTRVRSDKTIKSPLASIMFCSICGKTMRRTFYTWKGEKTHYYVCATSRCPSTSTRTEIVEEMVLTELKEELERQTTVHFDYEKHQREENNSKRMLSELNAELAKKQTMLDRACEAYETGIYDRTTYLQRTQKVNAEKADIIAQIEKVEVELEKQGNKKEKAIPILSKVVSEIHTLQPKEQNDLLKLIIDRIEYDKTVSDMRLKPELKISLKI